MNRPPRPGWQRLAFVALLLVVAVLPPAVRADIPDYGVALPLVIAPPGTLPVDDEVSLRHAIETANAADQLPRIELRADIELTAPLPQLHNPGAGTVTIFGNGHTIDAKRLGSVLAVGPNTTAIFERLKLTGGSGNGGIYSVCGGGIYSAGHLTLRQVRVEDNWAVFGGGICVEAPLPGGAVLTLEESSVSGNTGYTSAGGIYAESENEGDIQLNINDSLLQFNRCTNGNGGGIYVSGENSDVAININGSQLQANAAQSGGGIAVYAGRGANVELNVDDSTLSRNRADRYSGGGIFSGTYEGHIAMRISRSAVSFNSAANAGGLSSVGPTVIVNSTFSGNVASGSGGAIIHGVGPMQLLYSTVTGNRADQGSGIWNTGWLEAAGSIIADNDAIGRDCWLPITSAGYNLDGDGTCSLDQQTDLPNGDPDLQPLALVPPGTTATHALGPASQARDRIPAGILGCDPAGGTDQRGVSRPQPVGGGCDMGAFEAERP